MRNHLQKGFILLDQRGYHRGGREIIQCVEVKRGRVGVGKLMKGHHSLDAKPKEAELPNRVGDFVCDKFKAILERVDFAFEIVIDIVRVSAWDAKNSNTLELWCQRYFMRVDKAELKNPLDCRLII